MSNHSASIRNSRSIAPTVPPGFQGKTEEPVLTPFVPQHQAVRKDQISSAPTSFWNRLEPPAPAVAPVEEVEEAVEVSEPETVVPKSLIEQVLMENSEQARPFAIQPRFTRPDKIDPQTEEESVVVVAQARRQGRQEMSQFLSIWGKPPRPERQAVVQQMMVDASTQQEKRLTTQPEEAAVQTATKVVAEQRRTDSGMPPLAESNQPEAVTTETVASEPALSVPPSSMAEAVKEAAVAEPAAEQPPVADPPVTTSTTSMLDAVQAVATQARKQMEKAETKGGEQRGETDIRAEDAVDNRATDQVAEVIEMIEREDNQGAEVAAVTPKQAMEAGDKEEFTEALQAVEEESEQQEDPHFNEALDKITGTRATDSDAAQRREAIRHFTASAARKRAERRSRVATGAPAIVDGMPPSGIPRDKSVEVETLGGGVLNLLSNGVKGVASIGRYSLMGLKYGLADSKSALGKITSKE